VKVLSYQRKAGSRTFGFLGLAFLVVAGLLWAAALIGIRPVATSLQTVGEGLMLFMVVSALILILGCLAYGVYHALRHIRVWPQAARTTGAFLVSNAEWAILLRHTVLPLAAAVFLFLAARSYYACHFTDGCMSTRLITAADKKAIMLGGMTAVTLALVAFLRIGSRQKLESEKEIEAFRAWLRERAALRSQQIDATSRTSNHRALLETERAEIESILIHFNKCFPRG
jgi:hypothetical protein